MYRRLLEIPLPERIARSRRAEWLAALGEHHAALQLLEREVASGAMLDIFTPAFDAIRAEPRFIALPRRMGLEP